MPGPGSDSQNAYRDFVARYGLENVPQMANADGRLWFAFDVSYQPRWVLVRADGSVDRGAGSIPHDVVQDALTPA